MDYFEKFIEIINELEREKVEYVLVGGYAVILHGLPRFTQDIDLFIKPESINIEKFKKALYTVFKDDSIKEITLDMLNEYPVIRYGTPEEFYIDIIVRIGSMFSFSDIEYEIKKIDSHSIKVATAETLYAMKKDTVRPIDKSDSLFLQELIKKSKKKQENM